MTLLSSVHPHSHRCVALYSPRRPVHQYHPEHVHIRQIHIICCGFIIEHQRNQLWFHIIITELRLIAMNKPAGSLARETSPARSISCL